MTRQEKHARHVRDTEELQVTTKALRNQSGELKSAVEVERTNAASLRATVRRAAPPAAFASAVDGVRERAGERTLALSAIRFCKRRRSTHVQSSDVGARW